MLGFMCACGVGRIDARPQARCSTTMMAKGGRKGRARRSPTPAASRKKPPVRAPPSAEKKGAQKLGSNDRNDSSQPDAVVEQASGSIGDVTAHRVFSPKGRASLADPLKEVAAVEVAASDIDETDGDAAVAAEVLRLQGVRARAAAVAAVVPEESLRWSWGVTPDQAVEMLAVADGEERLDAMVVTNRDLINFRMLYRFTSAILQAEGDKSETEAANMRTLRSRIIDTCWHHDRPLRDQLFDAERRLVEVLRSVPESNPLGEVEANCGTTTVDVNAFWLVVYGAVAAWEVRAKAKSESDEANQLDVQERIKIVADAINRSEAIDKHLSPALKIVGKVLTASNENDQAEALAMVDDAVAREMGNLLEQIRLWPQNAYGPFVGKLQSIVDAVVEQVSREPIRKLKPFRFTRPEIERTSRLVEFTKRNASQKR